jgi:hypothetical protein
VRPLCSLVFASLALFCVATATTIDKNADKGSYALADASVLHHKKRIIGKLAISIVPTKIYMNKSRTAKVYFSLKFDQYLVVQGNDGSWSAVLLKNGMSGYVPSSDIQILPYQVAKKVEPGHISKSNLGSAAALAIDYVDKNATRDLKGGGLVSVVFAAVNVDLPRSIKKQSETGKAVGSLEDLKAGDRLYFWSDSEDRLSFAGIFVGNGYFVAPLPGHKTISRQYLGEKKWLDALVYARR